MRALIRKRQTFISSKQNEWFEGLIKKNVTTILPWQNHLSFSIKNVYVTLNFPIHFMHQKTKIKCNRRYEMEWISSWTSISYHRNNFEWHMRAKQCRIVNASFAIYNGLQSFNLEIRCKFKIVIDKLCYEERLKISFQSRTITLPVTEPCLIFMCIEITRKFLSEKEKLKTRQMIRKLREWSDSG